MKRFDLTRHARVKRALNAQLKKAQGDARLLSLGRRYRLLAIYLYEMNLRGGYKGRFNPYEMTVETIVEDLKKFQAKLIAGLA